MATISGGALLTLLQRFNGGDAAGAYSGVFALQMLCFLTAAWMTSRLDLRGFRAKVQTSLSTVSEMAVD